MTSSNNDNENLATNPELYFKEEKEEDCLQCIVNLLDPLAYIRVITSTFHKLIRVFASFRHVRFLDFLSGIILGILTASFGIVYSYTIFDDAGLDAYIGAGGATQAISIIIGGLGTSLFSDVGASISSPDLNPAIFFGNMATITKRSMTLSYAARNRTLPGIGQQAIFSTILASMIITVTLLGIILYFFARFRLTRVMQMLPDAVLTGFMASIGYIVTVKGFRTSMPNYIWTAGAAHPQWWYNCLPAIGFGMIMYIRMRYKIGNPAIVIPLIMAIPLIAFYIILYAAGSNVETARKQGWMTPLLTYDGPGIASTYDASYGSARLVDWRAVGECVPQMFLVWIVVIIDVLLKLAAVRKVLQAGAVNFEHEVMLIGKTNFFCGLLVGAPAYSQPVLAAVNYNVIQNKVSRAPGLIAVLFNLILWAVSYPIVNFLPRFWLAGLIFFSAWGFIVDNLIDSARRLNWTEYFVVWLIVIINALVGLGWAILCGVVTTAMIFAIMYGRGGSIKSVNSGADVRSSVIRSPHEDKLLTHLGNTVIVIQLHRYLFFGSATQLLELVQGIVEAQADFGQIDRVRFFIFDFADVEAIDSTAVTVFGEIINLISNSDAKEKSDFAKELAELANQEDDPEQPPSSRGGKNSSIIDDEENARRADKMLVLFTGLSKRLRKSFNREGVLKTLYEKEFQKIAAKVRIASDATVEQIPEPSKRCFDSVDLGMEWIEERLLEKAHVIRKRWLRFESFARLHNIARHKAQEETFQEMMWNDSDSLREFAQYIETIQVPKGSTLWRAGDVNPQLYLLQSGKLTAYVNRFGLMSRSHSYRRGSFVNEDGLYLDSPVANTVLAEVDSVILLISRESMKRLVKTYPAIAANIQANVLKHSARTKMMLNRGKNAIDFYRAARFTSSSAQVAGESETPVTVVDENNMEAIRPTGATRFQEDVRSLMDINALSQGVRNGRRIAKQFSKQVWEAAADSGPKPSISVKPTTRSAAVNIALAEKRNFSSVISYEDLDERVKSDWRLFVGEGQTARPDDVTRVIPSLTTREAREMIWISDLEDRGGASFFDLLDTLTTTWESEFLEPEIVPKRSRRGGGVETATFEIE